MLLFSFRRVGNLIITPLHLFNSNVTCQRSAVTHSLRSSMTPLPQLGLILEKLALSCTHNQKTTDMNAYIRYILLITFVQAFGTVAWSQSVTVGSLELISDQFRFTEGPAVDPQGNVYFTDQPNNTIWKYDAEGKLSLFKENAGRSNGLYIDGAGRLIACADEHNQLWAIHPDGSVDTLVTHYRDSHLNGPNDVWVSPSDAIYFTDPYYQRDYWTRKAPDMQEEAVYLYRNGQTTRLDADFDKPNGIIGSADGKLLYVADIGANKTYRYRVAADGSLTDKQLFVEQGSDGMTLDNEGNLYLTGRGVTVYDQNGNKIEHIDVPAGWTANVCFGGRAFDFLFITASEKVFKIKMRTTADR